MRSKLSKTEYNALSVRLELNGDVEEAMNAAAKIGDDALARSSGGAVLPESFTHGSSLQRQNWFDAGLKNGSVKVCGMFSTRNLYKRLKMAKNSAF